MGDTDLLWPGLSYDQLAPTLRLFHRGLQAVGKLTLLKPFEPQWANVVLLPTARGLTTGAIPWRQTTFAVDVDFVAHEIVVSSADGRRSGFALRAGSVADWAASLGAALEAVGVGHRVNPVPQEVPDPVPFHEDTEMRPYDRTLVEAWWRAFATSYRVFQVHHSRFNGKTPPVGLMWGSLDLRDSRFNGEPCDAGVTDYIGVNSMNESQSTAGWWAGSDTYPRAAYFAYTYPAPRGFAEAAVRPAAAHWEASLGEFILDYDDVRSAADPAAELLAFLESVYAAGAGLAGWQDYSCPGEPVPAPKGVSS